MNNKALYFPYINVPETPWMIQQLLYHDRIGSIVPSEFIYHPENLSPFMRDLVAAEQVEQVFPANHIPYDSSFESEFISLVKSLNYAKPSRESMKLYGGNNFVKIHIEKFGETLKNELNELGLLFGVDYPWCLVESRTANLLMAYVATVICNTKELQMSPLTNSKKNLNPFLNKKFNNRNRSEDETIILNSLLPVPSKVITVKELVDFKQRHSPLLTSFRQDIKKTISELSIISDEDTKLYEIVKFMKESKEQIDEISEKLKEKNWGKVNFVTICSLASSIIPTIDAIELNSPEDLYKAAPGLLGAAYSEFNSRKQEYRTTNESNFAYAAYYRNQFARK